MAYADLIDRVLTEYRCLKRLGCRCDESVPLCYLLAVDEEVEALRALEIEREVKLREAQRAAERGRRR